MLKQRHGFYEALCAVAIGAALYAGAATAQVPATPAARTAPAASTPEDAGRTQEKLLALLRMSPTLSAVVASDPALLANQEYVGRNNPELAQFLQEHPEVTRNPGFYLFSELRQPGQKPYGLLEPKQGFESPGSREQRSDMQVFMNEIAPVFALIACGVVLVWLVRMVLENRRWSRVFKLQSEVHGKLIDKFGTNQELLAYMQTESGRRFLEAAPIATEVDAQRVPNVVSRVLTTLQAGVVMILLGAGLLFVRHSVSEGQAALLILGVVILMPGIGFTISAGITWVLAGRLGLINEDRAQAAGLIERQ